MIAPVALTLLALSALAVGPSISAKPSMVEHIVDDGVSTYDYYGVNPVMEDILLVEDDVATGFDIWLYNDDPDFEVGVSNSCVLYFNADGSYRSTDNAIDDAYSSTLVISLNTLVANRVYIESYLPDLTYYSFVDGSYGLNVYLLRNTDVPVGFYYGNLSVVGNVYHLNPVTPQTLSGNGIVDGIADGLGVIGDLGGALVNGFDGVFMNGTTLSTIGSFSFILFGLGISVGIVKKCFNWVTGRHGM